MTQLDKFFLLFSTILLLDLERLVIFKFIRKRLDQVHYFLVLEGVLKLLYSIQVGEQLCAISLVIENLLSHGLYLVKLGRSDYFEFLC